MALEIVVLSSAAFRIDGQAGIDRGQRRSSNGEEIASVAANRFRSIDALVNNAGIDLSKPFTEYRVDQLHRLVSVNVEGSSSYAARDRTDA